MRTKPFLAALMMPLTLWTAPSVQIGDRGNAEVRVNLKRVRIVYGRPSLEGRDSWDMFNKARVGTVWRVGINEATEISSAGDLNVGGKRLAAGRYSLWVRKLSNEKWSLAFHPRTDIPGLPELTEGFVAEAALELSRVQSFNDRLLIVLTPDGNNVLISIYWGSSKLEGAVAVIS